MHYFAEILQTQTVGTEIFKKLFCLKNCSYNVGEILHLLDILLLMVMLVEDLPIVGVEIGFGGWISL
jgi:hypothetical protein